MKFPRVYACPAKSVKSAGTISRKFKKGKELVFKNAGAGTLYIKMGFRGGRTPKPRFSSS